MIYGPKMMRKIRGLAEADLDDPELEEIEDTEIAEEDDAETEERKGRDKSVR